MKNKNLLKVLFDLLMVFLFVGLYDANATGTVFHEIVGLILFALFVIHIFYNRKWVIQVGKKLFGRGLKKRLKVMYGLNICLLLAFGLVLVSGIRISHILFPSDVKASDIWMTLHIASALITIVLIAVHLGLHWKFIVNVAKKHLQIPEHLKKVLLITSIVTIVAIGVYGTVTISAPLIEKMQPKSALSSDEEKPGEMNHDESDQTIKAGEEKQPHEAASLTASIYTAMLTLSMVLLFTLLVIRMDRFADNSNRIHTKISLRQRS